jgi:hypothetical protein
MDGANKVKVGSYDKDGSQLSTAQRLSKVIEIVEALDNEFNFSQLMKVKLLNTSLKSIKSNMSATEAMNVFSQMTPDVLDRMIYENGSSATALGVAALPNSFATFVTAIKAPATSPSTVSKLRITTRNLLSEFAGFIDSSSLPAGGSYPSPNLSASPDVVRNIVSSYLDNAGLANTTADQQLVGRLLYNLYLIGGQEGFSTMNSMPVLADGLFNGAIYYLLSDTTYGFPASSQWKSGVANTYATMGTNITTDYTSIIEQRATALSPLLDNQEFNVNTMMATGTNLTSGTFNNGLVMIVEWLAGENNQLSQDGFNLMKSLGVSNEILSALARSSDGTEPDGFTISNTPVKKWYISRDYFL